MPRSNARRSDRAPVSNGTMSPKLCHSPRRIRWRPQRDLDRGVAGHEGARGARHPRDRDEDLQPDGRRPRPRPGTAADPPAARVEPAATRRRASGALPAPLLRPRRAAGGDAAGVRRAAAGRQDRRCRRLELHRRAARRGARAVRAGRAPTLRVGAERLLPARAGRPRDRLPRLPRARPRLHAVQPARRRLAVGQVPPRRGAARRARV